MMVLGKIAFYQNRRDEVPNQALANDLATRKDKSGIREIAGNLTNKNQNIRSDCLKVLYEVGYKDPELISSYADDFLALLDDRNNRMVWGAMIALGTIADLNPKPIWKEIDRIFEAIDSGSLITLVWGIRTVAKAAAKSPSRIKSIMPKLLQYLRKCNARDVPTHLESMQPIVNKANRSVVEQVVESRKKEMTTSHLTRLTKVLKLLVALKPKGAAQKPILTKVAHEMPQLRKYAQANCPEAIRSQIIQLMRSEWPATFRANAPEWPSEAAELDPVSFVLSISDLVVCHAAVVRKSIVHGGKQYLAFGICAMVTAAKFRRRGFGRLAFEAATKYMEQERADIGVFTCDAALRKFYECNGWSVSTKAPLVGGTKEKPFRSDELGKITLMKLFSDRAKAARKDIASVPIQIELGEGKLW